MKKIVTLASVALIAFSCSKESTQIVGANGRIKVYGKSELSTQISQKNTPFTFETNGKATDLSYTLKAVAEAPVIGNSNTDTTYATSIHKVGNLVYVTWHIVDTAHGGAVSVYDVSNPEAIVYLGRVDFLDTDFHDGAYYFDGSNKYMYVVGQRDRNSGAYENELAWHKGGIVGRITLDNSGNVTSTYSELPLAGFAGNGIALGASNTQMQVITGDGASEIYNINGATMVKTDSSTVSLNDGEYITSDGSNFYAFLGDKVGSSSSLKSYSFATDITVGAPTWSSVAVNYGTEAVERNAMTVSGGVAYLAMGENGVITVDGATVTKHADTYGGRAHGVTVNGDTVYVANGETNMLVAKKGATSADAWTLLGVRQGDGDYKSVHYEGGYLFVADATKGLLVIKQNN